MNPATADQSFELRRFPDLRDPRFTVLWFYLAIIVWQHWLFVASVLGSLFVYRFWRLSRPADYLRLSAVEILLKAHGFPRMQISKREAEEVSQTSTGVVIAWKKNGVPHYTRVNASWFEKEVWHKACPALLAWAPIKSSERVQSL